MQDLCRRRWCAMLAGSSGGVTSDGGYHLSKTCLFLYITELCTRYLKPHCVTTMCESVMVRCLPLG